MQHVNKGWTYGDAAGSGSAVASRGDARSIANEQQRQQHVRRASDGAVAGATGANGRQMSSFRNSTGHATSYSLDAGRLPVGRNGRLEEGEIAERRSVADAGRAFSPASSTGTNASLRDAANRSFSPGRPPSLPPKPQFPQGVAKSPTSARPAVSADPRLARSNQLGGSVPASSRPSIPKPSPPRERSTSSVPSHGRAGSYGIEVPTKSILKVIPTGGDDPPRPTANGAAKPTATSKPAMSNCLAGQKVVIDGSEKPIKPYTATMARLLRGFDATTEAFEDRRASTYAPSEMQSGNKALSTCLEVYFPRRSAKLEPHVPAECKGLCSGQTHPDDAIVCRFCKQPIGLVRRPQLVYDPLQALEHLEKRCALPEQDRQRLVAAFKEVDKHALPSGNTGTQPNANRALYADRPRKKQTSTGPSSYRTHFGSKSISVKRTPAQRMTEVDRIKEDRLERQRREYLEEYEEDEGLDFIRRKKEPEAKPRPSRRDGIFAADELGEIDDDSHFVEEHADGDDDFTYSRMASHEPPVAPPMWTPGKGTEVHDEKTESDDVDEEDTSSKSPQGNEPEPEPEPVRLASVDSTATEGQDFYIQAQEAQKQALERKLESTQLEDPVRLDADTTEDGATSLDLIKSIQEVPELPSMTDALRAKQTRVSPGSSEGSDLEVQAMLSGQRPASSATAASASASKLSMPQDSRAASSSASSSRASVHSVSATTRRPVTMEESEVPSPAVKAKNKTSGPRRRKPTSRSPALSTRSPKSPPIPANKNSSKGKSRDELFEPEEKSSEEDSDVPLVQSQPPKTDSSPRVQEISSGSESSSSSKRPPPVRRARKARSPSVESSASSASSAPDATAPEIKIYAADPRTDDDSDSSDGAYFVQASWIPVHARKDASSPNRRRSKPSALPKEAKGKGKQPEKRGSDIELKQNTRPGPSQTRKKPGAAARKSGRPPQTATPVPVRTPTPPPKPSARSTQKASSKRKKPGDVSVPSSQRRRKSNTVRNEPVISEADDTSSDTDSSDVIVPDEIDLTDQDTEEEIEAPPRITRNHIRSSPPAARSSPASAKPSRKRKRIKDSSAEEISDRGAGSGSGSNVGARRGKLVKLRDYRPPREKRKSKPVAETPEPEAVSKQQGDFPSVLDSYREVLLESQIRSMADLRRAVSRPERALKFVDYLAEDSSNIVLKSRVSRFAFGEAIESALTEAS